MAYTVVRDVCEGIDDCLAVCPTECIVQVPDAMNRKGTRYVEIRAASCIDCGACLSVCPIEGAIVDAWRPELQGQPPDLPCLRCPAPVAPDRRFCPACGAPVAARGVFEDLALLDRDDLARLVGALMGSAWGTKAVSVVSQADPALAARIQAVRPTERAGLTAAGPAGPEPAGGDLAAARRVVAYQLRLLVARRQMRYTGQG